MASQPPQQAPQLKSILVAVPSTGGIMKAKTAESLFRLARALTAQGINCDMYNINGSDVVTVRNVYANMILKSNRWDGLLFIDSDMEFDPSVVMRMVKLNAGVSAAACTTRELDLKKYHERMKEHGDDMRARAEASRFNVLRTFDQTKSYVMKKVAGFYTMAAVGMAVCLIRKSALEAMVKEGVVDKRIDVRDSVEHESWGFFDQQKVGGIMLLEDFSFCYRWSHLMKRPLWVCVDVLVKHLGDWDYGAPYAPVLERDLEKGKTKKGTPGAPPVADSGPSQAEEQEEAAPAAE